MSSLDRRTWLKGLAALALVRGRPAEAVAEDPPAPVPHGETCPLALDDYQPRSMLQVPQTRVERSRFPVIDIHAHLGWSAGLDDGEKMTYLETPDRLLEVMDRKNIQLLVNVTGGSGTGLDETVATFDARHPGRFLSFTEPWWARAAERGYARFQADELERARAKGARGLKVLKSLGLVLREGLTSGPLVRVDDPRFDPMWEACGALKMPVAIHVSDPDAFFLPTDRFNERHEELSNHPDWSFHGKDFPSKAELLEARNRVFERHPKTQFLGLHVANRSEDLSAVAEWLERYPNLSVEMGARLGELGRQPRQCRKFFERYQDRILFGTDAVPPPDGLNYPQQVFGDELYEIYYRFLETEDEYFDYAPAPKPPQGRWRIYGIGLPEGILKKVYHDNAARLLGLPS